MDWKNKVVDALIEGDCFISTFQKMRFIQLFNRLKDEPFFTKAFCKCVFLASCDQEHTDFLTSVADKLIEKKAVNTDYMLKLSDEHMKTLKSNEKILFKLSDSFLRNPDSTPDESFLLELSRSWVPIGDCALQASLVIDAL
ncbi:MAG: hypothetical protein ACOX8E_03400 [Ruminococcus sp.]|jgi:hypothetical protein